VEVQENKNFINKIKELLFNDAIFLGVITAIGYCLAYTYELSTKGYYLLPNYFVSIDLTKIIGSSILVFLGIAIVILFMAQVESILSKIKYREWILFILFICSVIFRGYFPSKLMWMVIILIVIFLFYSKFTWHSPILKKAQIFVNLTTVLLIGVFISAGMGDYFARTKDSYLIINNPDPMVVIDTYKDYFIIAPVDLKNKTISPKFQLIEIKPDEKKPLILQSLKTGPLKVDEQPYTNK